MKIGRFIFSLFFITATIYVQSPSIAQNQSNLPTRLIPLDTGKQILLPDWQRISFSQIPAIQKNGSIKINGFSRQWNTGDTPDKYLTLGDIDEALKPQLFSLSNIANTAKSRDFSTYTLNQLPLLGKQTIQDLAEIVPNLGRNNTAQIKPIAALIKSKYPQTNINTSLSNLLSQNPELGKLKLNQMVYCIQSTDGFINKLHAAVQSGRVSRWVAASFQQYLKAKDSEKTIASIDTTTVGIFSGFMQRYLR